jgi:hypothetical protein
MADSFSALEVLLEPADPLNDPFRRQATAAALRRQNAYGVLGQLMGVQPTQRAGVALQDTAQQSLRGLLAKQQADKAAAARAAEQAQQQQNWQAEQAQQQQNWQAEQAQQQQRHRDQMGLQYAQERRLAAAQNSDLRAQWASAVDPVTGSMRLYNRYTGEWRDETPAGPAAPAQLPQFNPALGMRPTERMKNDLTGIQQQRGAIQGAVAAAEQNPQAFGFGPRNLLEQFGGPVGSAIAAWARNPQDTAARSFVLNNVSAIINERAGAAQSAQELARLRGFLPNETDSVRKVQAKFGAFLQYLEEREAATRGYTVEELRNNARSTVPPVRQGSGATSDDPIDLGG